MSERRKGPADASHRKGMKIARDARPKVPGGGDQVQYLAGILSPDVRVPIPPPLTGEALERRLEQVYDLILDCVESAQKKKAQDQRRDASAGN